MLALARGWVRAGARQLRIRLLRCVQSRGYGRAWLALLEPRASLGFGTLADDFRMWARVTSDFSEVAAVL
eukprot:1812992-Rhodomonas_salina.1